MKGPSRPTSAAAFAEIARTVAGGESSYARLRSGDPVVVEHAEGARIVDADGNTYLDYCGGYGVNLFGHNPRFVWEAVAESVARLGVHIAFPHRLYGTVGELVAELVPGVEQLRFANSGTEATQAALRLMRGATGRDVVLVFDGHYHGWADPVAAWLDGGVVRPVSAGVPASAVAALRVVPWNDPAALDEAIVEIGDQLAGSLCEVVAGSGGLVEPAPGYLEHLCKAVRGAGGLVAFDEVMTGFRLAAGGAQERFGVVPDVTVLGKIIGGGFALAAFGGPTEVMRVEAENRVVHGGTYTGSPVALAAAAAVLERIRDDADLYPGLEARSARLAAGIESAFGEHGIVGHVRRVGSMLQPFLSPRSAEPPRTPAEAAARQDATGYSPLCDALEAHGVYAHRYPLGRWFVSTAHDDAIVDETLERVVAAVARCAMLRT
ncbi:MAG: aminotransferase class III-fold pyridoxal phosphate-dependent enzyme [Gaiellales bacterium]